MTNDEAKDWLVAQPGVSRETMARLEVYVALLIRENERQNLVAPRSLDAVWVRHIADSAQLLPLADAAFGSWIDIGSGAGLPGLVIAILRDRPMILVEPRRKRAEFLTDATRQLGIDNVSVIQRDIEKVTASADVISARAVASLDGIFAMAQHLAHSGTRWLLPKGRSAMSELALANQAWHGAFHVEQSITESDSMIVVATQVSRRST